MYKGGAPKGNKNHYKHGLSHTRLDNIYKAMISRCYKENNNRYKNYGGRGICVCEEWIKNKTEFFKWAYENGYKDNLTIDRIDSNGNYEPTNCRWATYKQQANNRTTTKKYIINGEQHTVSEWSEISGVRASTIWNRIHIRGWNPEKAIMRRAVP